jgi:hypothetical protein
MKHVRTFEKYRIVKNREELIKEAVLQVNDIYKVKTMIDIPQSLLNSYIKKVKDTTGKNLRTFFGDVDLAEEIVKWVTMNFLDVEKIPGNALMGGAQGQVQAQSQMQGQPQVQVESQPQAQEEPMQEEPQAQEEPMQEEPQAQGEFEEPQAQGQSKMQDDEEEEEELPL